MDGHWFDRMARRQALRRIGGGLAGGILAALGLGQTMAVRAQDEATCAQCRECIAQFFGSCMQACTRMSPDRSICATACCEGARTTCTVIGECAPTCSATCPGEVAP